MVAPSLVHEPARRIVGLPLRTDNTQGFETIPAHWARFMGEGVAARVPGKRSDTVWAVYARFENLDVLAEGGIATLRYTLVIGAEVDANAPIPEGLTAIDMPAQRCASFRVASGNPQDVGACWQEIWRDHVHGRAFVADAERYQSDGRIDILVGLS